MAKKQKTGRNIGIKEIAAVLAILASITAIIGFAYQIYSDRSKHPELKLEIKSKKTFDIVTEYPYVNFRVYNIGEKSSESLQYLYYWINQSENTCNISKIFFNIQSNLCSFTIEEREKDKKYCESDTPSAQKEAGNYFTIEYYFHNETTEFKNAINQLNIDRCKLKETISICTYSKHMRTTNWCSEPVEYTITYSNLK